MSDRPTHRIFFFTGLGADERAFAQLKVPAALPQIHVAWLPPEKKENIRDYARRLIKEYHIQDGDILIGLSFGGLIATEISLILQPAFTLLISSASTRQELPLLYRITGKLHLYLLLPRSVLRRPGFLKYYFFSLKKKAQRKLFDEIISGADVDFVKWAIRQVVCWQNRVRPQNTYKIHGTADRIMPLHRASTDFVIQGGSHFLTWEKAREVSQIIEKLYLLHNKMTD
jgi:pimeloyl-ACP methyl ester carboxylesterase